MEIEFFEFLKKSDKEWLAKAMAGLIVCDGKVDKGELKYARHIFSLLGSKEKTEKLIKIMKEKNISKCELDSLKIDRELGVQMMIYLVRISVADQMLNKAEADYLDYIGEKLNFNYKFIHEIVRWLYEFDNQKKNFIIRAVEDSSTSYKS